MAEQERKVARTRGSGPRPRSSAPRRRSARPCPRRATPKTARAQETERARARTRERQRERADTLRVQAEQSESEARRLRLLAVARELAIKTSQLTRDDQRELAALLAVQAYRLHARSGGVPRRPGRLRGAARGRRPARAGRGGGDCGTTRTRCGAVAIAPGSGARRVGERRRHACSSSISRCARTSPVVARLDGERGAGASRGSTTQARRGRVARRPRARVHARPRAVRPATVGPVPGGVTALAVRRDGGRRRRRPGRLREALGLARRPRRRRSPRPRRAGRVGSLAFAGDGRLAAAERRRGCPAVGHGTAAGRAEGPGRGPQGPRRGASAEGRLAAGTEEGPILLWARGPRPPADRAVGPRLRGHLAPLLARTARGSRPRASTGRVRLWDATQRRAQADPSRRATPAGCGRSRSPADGEALVSGGADRTHPRSGRRGPSRSREAICARKTRNLTPEEWSAYLPADIPWEADVPVAGRAARPSRRAVRPERAESAS